MSDRPDRSPTSVPAPLDELGQVFVPIDPGKKGTQRPRTEAHLFTPDDPVLEAYFEAGHNYGIACRGDLAVLDADEPAALADLVDALPETASQVSGSRTSEHYFLRVPGLDEDIPLDDPETGENIGHVKAAGQSYVVGPGSRHPSGNRYGPLEGDRIATVEETDLREFIDAYRPDVDEATSDIARPSTASRTGGSHGDTPLDIRDVLTGYTEGGRTGHPFHSSETGANFMVDEGGETWRCWRHDCTGNALHLVGIEQGVIDCGDWDRGGLDTDTWREIFTAAREAGYDLPEFDPAEQREQVAVLPADDELLEPVTGWDWRQAGRRAGRDDDVLELDDARERTTDAIVDAYESMDRTLVEALPTLGKSYGAVEAAARTGEPVTVLTGRGRKEQYAQVREWADEHGLTNKTLPAFTRDCDTANGEHGTEWKETVMSWYRRGATPKAIHKWAEDVLGRPLPCQEHDGQRCPYATKWDFDPEDHPETGEPWDVLIGHYTHAHKSKVVQGRTVVVDEFPEEAYERRLDHGLEGAITHFLQSHDALPFDDYTGLLEGRHDEQRRADAIAWFHDHDLETEGRAVLEASGAHAAAPLATFTILAGSKTDLGNGWERAPFPDTDGRVGLFNREQGAVRILDPPALDYTRSVVALDGTPTKRLWELALGTRLTHRRILSDDERAEYLRDGLNLNLVRTTDAVKPYNNPDHVHVDGDAALLEEIADRHGEKPGLITSSTALHEYDAADVLDVDPDSGGITAGPAATARWYGNVLGSNELADCRLGAVIGSNHYGDGYVKKWGAYAGLAVERGDEKGADLTYGAFGDDVLRHMREHDTLQAAMRFGRDGNGAVVYVHTDTLPEWVPIAGEGGVVSTWSDGMKEVVRAASELGSWRTSDLVDHPDVTIGERQVREHLHALAEQGVVDVSVEGRGYVWRDDGLHRVGEHGDVELEPVDLEALDADEVAELERTTTTYTWEFRNSGDDPPVEAETTAGTGGEAASPVADAPSPPGDHPPQGG